MFQSSVVVKNKIGLHARPAAKVVAEGNKFQSNITMKKGEKTTNMKSILGVLSLAVVMGEEVTIQAEGEDEVQAVQAIVKLIESMKE